MFLILFSFCANFLIINIDLKKNIEIQSGEENDNMRKVSPTSDNTSLRRLQDEINNPTKRNAGL